MAKKGAEQWKLEGNASLKAGDHEAALECYAQGISAAAGEQEVEVLLSQLHSNRAHVFLLLGRPAEAIEECHSALKQDDHNQKAYWRGATAALRHGHPEAAAFFCRSGIMKAFEFHVRSQDLEEIVAKSLTVWEKAAAQGSADAQFTLGLAYMMGLGVAEDEKKCIDLWVRLAQGGDSLADRALQDFFGFQVNGGSGV
eukprot:gnl/TRDRNA2_/TRDRNA2_73293_c0_seq1.p1 gnl/TRDRNA2_/TRDRNA2_73293_c0~~gnl/TRDRNA2_/TRDRNA2_73293_c0_seq1.p1  ORF type:complete len:227 (-),score=42.29 gnl/TRDRNA2_/TRDRNA2_73293_c0_seq1:69-662(-)